MWLKKNLSSCGGQKSRAKDRVRKVEDRPKQITQNAVQDKNKCKIQKELRDMEGRMNRFIICLNNRNSRKTEDWKWEDEHFPEWIKILNLQFQEAQVPKSKNKINPHQNIL